MGALPSALRNQLAKTCVAAREAAEAGARSALQSLAVPHHEPHGSMTPEQRALRNRLRAHGRQLGDTRDPKRATQTIDRLVHECAYQHWHRMLFARFLAENHLLIEPTSGAPITIEECQDLARESGQDPWALASRYAQRMLPQIFRSDDPVLEVALPPETRQTLERLLADLPAAVFTADDSLGWTYQFWQSAEKDRVNASGEKITAATLPAVTQLFTEPYMVQFLLHNTLGAWWAGKVAAASSRWSSFATEAEARQACALPGVTWDYLRFVRVEAASSRSDSERRQDAASTSCGSGFQPLEPEERQDAASTLRFYDKNDPVEKTAANLPHWRQEGVIYFVTFRTADSLPQDRLQEWLKEKEEWLAAHPEPHNAETMQEYYQRFPERIEHWLDQGYGACHLKQPAIRQVVHDALKYFDGQRYALHEFVVAANHVHVLLTPKHGHQLSDILHSWKSFTANQINRQLGQSGTFWQKESFDHIVRSEAQFERIREYIRGHEVEAASSRSDSEKRQDAASTSCGSGFQPLEQEKRQDAASTLRPAAGTFDGWPKAAKDIKVLDPCCGSGHFLVAALHHLVPIRMAEEGLSGVQAVDAVLRDNLYGLEIDERCCQIAAFNLALAAWKISGWKPLPPLHLACSGIGPQCSQQEWVRLAEKSGVPMPTVGREAIKNGLLNLHRLFSQAPTLGSLIDPRQLPSDLIAADYETLQPYLTAILKAEQADDETRERAIAAAGMVKAAELLSGSGFQPLDRGQTRQDAASAGYTLVITNVPYLGRGKQDSVLKKHLETHFPAAKADLATAFVQRCLEFCQNGNGIVPPPSEKAAGSRFHHGCVALVTPQNWLFLTSYKKLREQLLKERTWNLLARLGPGAFETISGHVVNVALLTISEGKPTKEPPHIMAGVDVAACRTPAEKAALLRGESGSGFQPLESADLRPDATATLDDEPDTPPAPAAPAKGSITLVPQAEQLKNPDARITLYVDLVKQRLHECALGLQGLSPADLPRYGRNFWEAHRWPATWRRWQTTVEHTEHFAGRQLCLDWNSGLDQAIEFGMAYVRGEEGWGQPGVIVNQMSSLPATIYDGDIVDTNAAAIVPTNAAHLPAIWCFCSSPAFAAAVRRIDQKLNVTNATLVKVPFDLAYWQKVAAEKYPHGLPEPQSNDPTQWLFHGHPAGMVAAGPASASPLGIADPVGADRHPSLICRTPNPGAVLQVAVARLLGYRWPAEQHGGSGFQPLEQEKRQDAASTCCGSGFQPLEQQKRQDAASTSIHLDEASRAWVSRCAELHRFADEDGIVCISPVRGEESAAERLRHLLAAAFGDAWSAECERRLIAATGSKETDLDGWLRNDFFEQHCKLFHDRPFIWHIWDGRPDGFHALVNYHKLCGSGFQPLQDKRQDAASTSGRRLLESLTYAYLGDWIERQKAEQREGQEGADARLAAAQDLQEQLKKILEGEPPYDIFVRWKPLREQPIGWEPDINDGVRLNIRPFMLATLRMGGKKGAGILRAKPNINWKKDRGKEPQSLRPKADFPWFWSCDPEKHAEHRLDFMGGAAFDGNRWNDLHYSNEVKRAARGWRAREGAGRP